MTDIEALVAFISERLDDRAAQGGAALVHMERRILGACVAALNTSWMLGEEARAALAVLAMGVMRRLAEPYKAHPDYDEAWAL